MGGCMGKKKKPDMEELPTSSSRSRSHSGGLTGKDSDRSQRSLRKQDNEKTISQMGSDANDELDEYLKFLKNGGSLAELLAKYKPPAGHNEKLLREKPVGFKEGKDANGNPIFTAIIHIDDELVATKRHFLAFFNLIVHRMPPEDFMRWCVKHDMHNTTQDYLALYKISKYHGLGSISLLGLTKDARAISVEVSDRFVTGRGVKRAITFVTRTRPDALHLINAYMGRLEPATLRAVRTPEPPLSYEPPGRDYPHI